MIVGSPNVNAGYRLASNKDYPEIADDFARTFKFSRRSLATSSSAPRRILWNDRKVPANERTARARTRSSTPKATVVFVAHEEQIFRDALTAQRQALAKDKAH